MYIKFVDANAHLLLSRTNESSTKIRTKENTYSLRIRVRAIIVAKRSRMRAFVGFVLHAELQPCFRKLESVLQKWRENLSSPVENNFCIS